MNILFYQLNNYLVNRVADYIYLYKSIDQKEREKNLLMQNNQKTEKDKKFN